MCLTNCSRRVSFRAKLDPRKSFAFKADNVGKLITYRNRIRQRLSISDRPCYIHLICMWRVRIRCVPRPRLFRGSVWLIRRMTPATRTAADRSRRDRHTRKPRAPVTCLSRANIQYSPGLILPVDFTAPDRSPVVIIVPPSGVRRLKQWHSIPY